MTGGVTFQDKTYCSEKNYLYGTHRSVPPEITFEKIRPYFSRVGLTRLANVTGLDRIGIPTVLSVRPNSLYLSVDAGKGFTLKAAEVSAAMESIERYAAEKMRYKKIRLSYTRLKAQHETIPVERLPFAKDSVFNADNPESWSLGFDIVSKTNVAVPVESIYLVNMKSTDAVSFQFSSNGLASGNNFLEALCMGIFEVIERDAVTCFNHSGQRPRVRLESVEFPLLKDLLNQLKAARVATILFDCTTDTQVPVYMAYIYDLEERNIGMYRGYGAHLDPEIAMIRAITEAVQARVVYIAGARDDFFKTNYTLLKMGDDKNAFKTLEDLPQTVDGSDLKSLATGTFEGDIHICIDRLKALGLDRVIVFDLTPPGFDLSVIKVVIPGLEGYQNNYYTPGRRALALMHRPNKASA